MFRDPQVLLTDILEAMNRIETYVANVTRDDFEENQMLQDAVYRNLEVIGEAASKLPKEFRDNCGFSDWHRLIALRNIIIHQSFGIDNDLIWTALQENLLVYKSQLQKLIGNEINE